MSNGRIEGESPQQIALLPEEETKKSPLNGPFSQDEVQAANEIIRTAQEKGEQVEQAALVKTQIKGIKARNPIIVVMLIMQVVSETLKQSCDNNKEVTKLTKREWKAFTVKQSDNFRESKESMEGGKAQGIQFAALACKFAPTMLNMVNARYPINNFNYDTVSTMANGGHTFLSTAGQQHMQATYQGTQINESLFQHEVGIRGTDHQRMSQDPTEQAKNSADEKLPQLLSIVSRMMTERA